MTGKKSKPYYTNNAISIYRKNFLTDAIISRNSIDLIVTSPPYNVDIPYGSNNDAISYGEYLAFTKKWLKQAYKVARSSGRLCLNIPLDKNKGGQKCVFADIVAIAKDVGWKYHTTIIWNEQNISRRTAWGSWMSASAPYIIAPVEMILVLYKDSWKKEHQGTSDIERDEFIDWTLGVWTFNGENAVLAAFVSISL